MIQLINMEKNYDAFHLNISMEIKPGMITGLIGKNGAGKSTTFKAIMGLISADGGTVKVFGKNPKDLTEQEKSKIGICLSDSFFPSVLTIKNISAILKNTYPSFDKNYFESNCNKFSLPMNQPIKDFSTGMKAKVKVLSAISHGADILILDEPTSGLDVTAREDIHDMLQEFMESDENHSILISSHISSDLEKLCDDMYMIQDGRIILHEDNDVLQSDYGIIKVDKNQFEELDKQYIIKVLKSHSTYECLTNEKQFYMENYPRLVIEKNNLDEMIMILVKGEEV